MSSRVYFRFSSSTDFDSVTFEGEVITIGELKYLISKKTGVLKDRNTVVELFDSRTGEEYLDPNARVAKNASVEAKRSPAVRPPPISVPVKTPTPVKKDETTEKLTATEPREETVDDGLGPGVFAPTSSEPADDDAAISLLVNRFGEVWRSDLTMQPQWRRVRRDTGGRRGRGGMRMGRTNLPPMGYVCHRCNTPGHYIEECPTNGDPAYDFVRVRYPTGIPSSMLEKDEEGGLVMPDGGRGRLKANTEKFRKEMEGVPGGESTVKRLMAPSTNDALMDAKFTELSNIIAANPFATIAPLLQSHLPQAKEVDIRKGFFEGRPIDQQTFFDCRAEYDRAKDAFKCTPPAPTNEWTPAPLPSKRLNIDNGQWRPSTIPTEMHEDRQWQNKAMSYYPPVDRKPPPQPYQDQPTPWHPSMQGYYDPTAFHHPSVAYPYHPEQSIPRPPTASPPAPALPSTVVRLNTQPRDNLRSVMPENGQRSMESPALSTSPLPYGFTKQSSTRHVPTDEPEEKPQRRSTRSRSRSPERSARRKSEHRESSIRPPSIKGSKSHKTSKDKSHSRRKDKERRSIRKEMPERMSPAYSDKEGKRHRADVGLDRWELEGSSKAADGVYDDAVSYSPRYTTSQLHIPPANLSLAHAFRDRYKSDKRLERSHSDRERRSRHASDLSR